MRSIIRLREGTIGLAVSLPACRRGIDSGIWYENAPPEKSFGHCRVCKFAKGDVGHCALLCPVLIVT